MFSDQIDILIANKCPIRVMRQQFMINFYFDIVIITSSSFIFTFTLQISLFLFDFRFSLFLIFQVIINC